MPLFGAAIVFGGLANFFAFFILLRMGSLGYKVGIWRTLGRDWDLYREFWRIAPSRNWSRAPLPLALVSFVVAATLLVMAAWSH